MSLQRWQANGWLIAHTAKANNIRSLFEVADRNLSDCQASGLSADARFGFAYMAARELGMAALNAEGYEPARGQSHHFRAIQSLAHTIGADATIVDQLDQGRKKRNISEYDRIGMISDQEADEMIELAERLRQDVEAWFQGRHPDLM